MCCKTVMIGTEAVVELDQVQGAGAALGSAHRAHNGTAEISKAVIENESDSEENNAGAAVADVQPGRATKQGALCCQAIPSPIYAARIAIYTVMFFSSGICKNNPKHWTPPQTL